MPRVSGNTPASAELPKNMLRRGDIYYVRVKMNGRERWRSTGHTTLAMAERRAAEILTNLRADRDWKRAPDVPTFGEWFATYLETHAPTSVVQRPGKLSRAVNKWRHRPIDSIRPTDVKAFLNELGKDWSSSTVGLQHRLLTGVFNRAKDDGLIDKSPMEKVERPDTAIRMRVLSHEEETKLRTVLAKRPDKERWLTFMLGTGLRLGEGYYMRGDWVKGNLIYIPAEVTKTAVAREVPIFPHVWEVLEPQLRAPGAGRIWPWDPNTTRKWLKVFSKKAGIEHVWPHALRHTFATRYLQGGGDIYVLSRILGHASVTMTEKIYAHLKKDDLFELSKGVKWGNVA